MIKFSATNVLVHSVSPMMEIESKSGGQPFYKRELIIDDSWDKDGKHYSNFVSIEFTGDKMSQLDSIYPGQRVNVDGLLSGREYYNRIYNSVRGQTVAPYQAQQQYAPAPAPMPGGYPQQPAAPAYPQQPQQYAPQPAPATAPVAAPVQQPYSHPSSPGVADLPFQH